VRASDDRMSFAADNLGGDMCMYASVSAFECVCLSVCVCACVHQCVCLSVYLCVVMRVSGSVYVF